MNKLIFWLITITSIFILLYSVSNIITPFLIALIFAYLLQPAINLTANILRISRNFATNIIFIVFLGSFIITLIVLIPIIYDQITRFIHELPHYKNNFNNLTKIVLERFDHVNYEITSKISDFINNVTNSLFSAISSFANHIWEYTIATINFFIFALLTPLLLYYFLKGWPDIINSIESLLPLKGKDKVKEIVISINDLLSAYIRGQLNICICVSIYYLIGFLIIGLKFALLLALFTGFSIIIPFIGIFLSYLLVAISCYFSFGFGYELLYVSILFLVGNILEGYIISPKIIGDRIGLHPVWIMFAVLAGASVLGGIGIIFAIPMAGVIKVLINYIINYYKSSKFYNS